MVLHRFSRPKRRGGIALLAAILSTFMIGMVAFAVDTSWIVLTRSELQNAADSAALAGAGQLMSPFVLYNVAGQTSNVKATILTGAIASAKTVAKQFAGYNA